MTMVEQKDVVRFLETIEVDEDGNFVPLNTWYSGIDEDYKYAIGQAIKALEQEPCEDAISRAEAIRIASGYCHPANIAKELAKFPPVQPERKTGYWILGRYKDTCSHCRCTYPKDIGFKNYCPNCGAKMAESEE